MDISKAKQAFIENYCQEKGYQINPKEVPHGLKLEISNLSEKVGLVIYHTGKVVPEGNPKSLLRKELEDLKSSLEQNPDLLKNLNITVIKSCNQKYEIIVPTLQVSIKEALSTLSYTIELQNNPNINEIYRAKIQANTLGINIIQYKTGTLFIQGKQDRLFDEVCSLIEKIAKPSNKEVVVRFIADDKDALDNFNAAFNPEIIHKAEIGLVLKLGNDVYNFLEDYDKKYLVAAECLRICQIPLPEFSPIVMPASKGLEGFTKKLVIGLGIVDATHFDSKTANFSVVKDKNQPRTKAVIDKERYCEPHLVRLMNILDMYRNFMLHSDNSSVSKVNTIEEAEIKLDNILREMKEIFNYFKSNTIFGI